MYIAMLNGSRPSADFLDSKLIFPPKGKEDGDTESQCRRHPGKTRPLCLSGCDNKGVAALLAVPLSEVADVTVDQCQAGLRGRSMTNNIVQLEAKALQFLIENAPDSGIIALDQAAAFPTLLVNVLNTYCIIWT